MMRWEHIKGSELVDNHRPEDRDYEFYSLILCIAGSFRDQ
jgi:hypothetical protein